MHCHNIVYFARSVFFSISHVISHFCLECSVLLTPSPGVFRCLNFVLCTHLAFIAFTAIVYTSGSVDTLILWIICCSVVELDFQLKYCMGELLPVLLSGISQLLLFITSNHIFSYQI